ncbi:MAG TPA: hypothetical protein VMF35_09935 [Acidimicrobiales bacterium]|nr:hypothetical protein [Acidimicrobiales bacterium]
MTAAPGDKGPDPLGKRALFWVPEANAQGQGTAASATISLPAGKRALFSTAPVDPSDVVALSGNPLAERGAFTVKCQRCSQTSHVGALDLLIFQFPIGFWRPRRRFDHRMTCPSCRKRAWCSVTLRRG